MVETVYHTVPVVAAMSMDIGKKSKDRRRKRPREDGEQNAFSSTCTEVVIVKGGDDDDKVFLQRTVKESKPTQEASTSAVARKKRKRKKKHKRKNWSLNESSPYKKQKLTDGKDDEDSEKATNESESKKDAPSFPYPTEADDHCETPLQAYQDILPLLQKIAGTNENICVYDPYYCDAAVAKNLNELGFANVYNQKEDCYQTWNNADSYPDYDIFLTNPPYSGNHMEKLMQHVTSAAIKDRPWFLLMPNWVHKKDFYIAATSNIRPFYVVPHKRYVYVPPTLYREAKKSDVHKKSSPWHSMWYIWGGSSAKNEQLIRAFYTSNSADHCDLARSKSALRDLRRKKKN